MSMFDIPYYVLPIILLCIAYLYYIVEESLSVGLIELLFFNCVSFIDKLVDTCVKFISIFVKFVRKLGYIRWRYI